MASKYPNELDDDSTLPTVIDGATDNSAEAIEALRAATLAVERTVGSNPQGSQQTLADRLDASLNSDGTIKASALAGLGTVTLPITDSQISSSAAISESKLDLDHTTQSLQDQISSNDTDILNLQTGLSGLSGQLAQHVVGTANQHNATDVLVSPSVFGGGTVAAELAAAKTDLQAHITDPAAHTAAAISLDTISGLDAGDVQTAIEVITSSYLDNIEQHRSGGHSDGVTAADSTALLVSTYADSGQTITKVSHINAAAVRSRGFVGANLSPSASEIQIELFSSGIQQTVVISGIETAIDGGADYPTAVSVAKYISSNLSAARALATAFADRGEIVIQHNLPDGYMIVSDSGASAVDALGLADSRDLAIYADTENAVYAGGKQLSDLALLADGYFNFTTSASSIDIGIDAVVGMLVHVVDHSADAIGTYRVTGAAGTTAVLSGAISAGSGTFRVYSDSLALQGAYTARLFGIHIDSTGHISATTEAQATSLSTTSYALLRATYSGTITLQYSADGANTVVVADDGYCTTSVSFPTGFIGELPPITLSRGYLVLGVTSATPDVGATDTVQLYGEDSGFAKVWMIGASGVATGADNRSGTTTADQMSAATIATIRGSMSEYGVRAGADPLVSLDLVIIPRQEWVSGSASAATAYCEIDSTLLSGDVTIYVSAVSGEILIGGSTGNTLADILARHDIPLCSFDAADLANTLVDVRFFSDFASMTRTLVVGKTAKTVAGALLVAAANGTPVVVADNVDATATIEVPGGVQLHITGNLAVDGDLVLAANSKITVDGTCAADSLQATSASAVFAGAASFATAASGIDSSDVAFADMVVNSIAATDSHLAGLVSSAPLTIASGSVGSIGISGEVRISSAAITRTAAALPLMTAAASSVATLDRCQFSQTGSTLSTSALTNSSYAVFASAGAEIRLNNCSKQNIAHFLSCTAGQTRLTATSCSASASGGFVSVSGAATYAYALVSDCSVTDQHGADFIAGTGASIDAIVDGCTVACTLPSSATRRFVTTALSGSPISNIMYRKCTYADILSSTQAISGSCAKVTMADCIFDSCSFDGLLCGSNNTGAPNSYVGNTYTDCAGVFMYGSSIELNGSTVDYASGGTNNISSVTGLYTAVIRHSKITMPDTAGLNLRDSVVEGNEITAGSIVFGSTQISGGSAGYIVRQNKLRCNDAGSATAVTFIGTGTPVGSAVAPCIASGNTIYGSPTTQLVWLRHTGSSLLGSMEFSNNTAIYELPTSGQAVLRVSSVSGVSGDMYTVSGNTLKSAGSSGAINYGILLEDGYCQLYNNIIDGSDLSTGVIYGVSGRCTNTRATKNTVLSIASGIDTLTDAISLPASASNYWSDNNGIKTAISAAPFSAFPSSGTWSTSAGANLQSGSIGATISLPLPQVAGLLIGVEVDITSGGAGEADIALYEIRKQPLSHQSLATASNTLATQTVMVSSGNYIEQNSSFYVSIVANAVGVRIGTIRAIVRT